jgi:hypothetical protein
LRAIKGFENYLLPDMNNESGEPERRAEWLNLLLFYSTNSQVVPSLSVPSSYDWQIAIASEALCDLNLKFFEAISPSYPVQ